MKNPERTPADHADRKDRRRPEHAEERRFTNAWREIEADRTKTTAASESPWRKLRRFSNTRSGRIVMLAPLGAIGAYLLLRKKR